MATTAIIKALDKPAAKNSKFFHKQTYNNLLLAGVDFIRLASEK
jgi:hypothetical protein